MANSVYYGYIELKENQCADLTDGADGVFGGALYAIKNTDYSLWQAINDEYHNRLYSKDDSVSATADDYYNNTFLPTLKRIAYPSSRCPTYDITVTSQGCHDYDYLFPAIDENGNTVPSYKFYDFKYEITASIVSVTSELNYVIKKRVYVYNNGTRKTVNLEPSTPATNPAAKPTPKSTPKSTSTITPTPTPVKPSLTSTTLTKFTAAKKTTTLTSNSTGLRTNETLTLTGTTSPNAKVTLTIQSNPITVDLTADATGKWTYTLNPKTLKLALGSHAVTAVATSSEGIKSDPVTLATFTLKSPPTQTPIKPEKYNYLNAINIAAAILILILLFVYIIKFKSFPDKQPTNHQEKKIDQFD